VTPGGDDDHLTARHPRERSTARRHAAEAARDRIAAVHGLAEARIFPVEFAPHLVILGALTGEHHDGTRHPESGR